jgi:hypothetical protein
MSAPTFTLFERNGSGSGTLTNSVTTVAYASTDTASTSSLSAANPVAQSANSYEKYNGLQVASVATNAISALSVYFNSTAPTDSGSTALPIKYGVTTTYTAPVATTSSVATTATTSTTSAPGTTMTAPSNTVSSNSGYLVSQAQVGSSAAGGNAIFPSPFIYFQYTWS